MTFGSKCVRTQLDRLDAAQNRELNAYCKRLGSSRDPKVFDSHLLSIIRPYLKDESRVKDEIRYLDSIGYNSSKYEYHKIEEQLLRFLENDHSDFRWNRNYKRAKEILIEDFSRNRVEQLHFESDSDILAILPERNTSTGYDGILTGIRKKKEFCEDGIQKRYLAVEDNARMNGTFNNIILIGSRTQASGAYDADNGYVRTGTFKSKSRLVSMVRAYLILAECKFAKPLQWLLGTKGWYAGGKNDTAISSGILDMKLKHHYSMTIDYSHYDQSISSWLIRDAFEIMEAAFYKFKFDKQLFDIIREDMINKYFIDAKGDVRESHKGVGSGSMFTQLVDSIVNKLMITTYMLSIGEEQHFDCMIMGDDNLIYTDVEINAKHLCTYLEKNFGIECNEQKCSKALATESPEFLSRVWTPMGVWRAPEVLISKMFYPETFRNYKEGADPYLIIYAYILSFPRGMYEIMHTEQFIDECIAKNNILKDHQKIQYLNGLMKYRFNQGWFEV